MGDANAWGTLVGMASATPNRLYVPPALIATCLVCLIRLIYLIFSPRCDCVANVTDMQSGRTDERMMNRLVEVVDKDRKRP